MSNDPPPTTSRRRLLIAQVVAYLAAWCILLPVAICRWGETGLDNENILGWPSSSYWDTPLYLPLLLVAPLAWWFRGQLIDRRRRNDDKKPRSPMWTTDVSQNGPAGVRAWMMAIGCGVVAFSVSALIARHFEGLPPTYHDEYSYLFQAQTFLAGKVSFPSHEAPRLFDQMHVLNEGRFASRYFPGTGLWMAPFVAIGQPYWGHWLAGAVTAFFVFWTARELGGDGTGFVAGMLIAISPGMAWFSNMLLAHHPTLVGLSLFLFAFVRWRTRKRLGYALCAGIGLTFAMYCRPMTAAGVGLPFGIAFAYWLVTAGRSAAVPLKTRLLHAVALGGPIVLGIAAMLAYNHAITGSALESPYQLYTDIYTPRHVYGFNNVERGEQRLGPRVLDGYDRWAKNLTPRLATKNVVTRSIASLRWTLDFVPLCMAAIVFVVAVPRRDSNAWLMFWAIVSLHAAHIPYWYDGIMHWHYVFESGPLWCIVFAVATARLVLFWRADNRPWMPRWWTVVVLSAVWMSYGSFDPYWEPRITHEIDSVKFGRRKHFSFQQLIAQQAVPKPAIVFVEADPADRHIDYVVNDPDLQADILVAHYLPDDYTAAELQRLFPGRSLFLFRAQTGEFGPLPLDR